MNKEILEEIVNKDLGIDQIVTDAKYVTDGYMDVGIGSSENLPVEQSFWGKFKAFWLQEVEQDNFWFQPVAVSWEKEKQFFRNVKKVMFTEIKFTK